VAKKSALARFVDHRFARERVKFRNDVVASLTADQNAAHRTEISDGRFAASTDFLGGWQIGQIGAVPFAGVDDRQICLAPAFEQTAIRIDRAAELGDIVAEHFPKPARLEEVTLHVDDEERATGGLDFVGIRFGLDAHSGSVGHDK
jgi:hypothetical protein